MAAITINNLEGMAVPVPNSASSGPMDTTTNSHFLDFDSRRLLTSLATSDSTHRAVAIDYIIRRVDDWFLGYGSPVVDGFLHAKNNGAFRTSVTPNVKDKLLSLLPDLQRLSTCCPFEDVRKAMTALVASLKERGCNIPLRKCRGPSYFIPAREVM